jgi:hypothetical protein
MEAATRLNPVSECLLKASFLDWMGVWMAERQGHDQKDSLPLVVPMVHLDHPRWDCQVSQSGLLDGMSDQSSLGVQATMTSRGGQVWIHLGQGDQLQDVPHRGELLLKGLRHGQVSWYLQRDHHQCGPVHDQGDRLHRDPHL